MKTGVIIFLILLTCSIALLIYLDCWCTKQIGKKKKWGEVYDSGDMLRRAKNGYIFASILVAATLTSLLIAGCEGKLLEMLWLFVGVCIGIVCFYGLVVKLIGGNNFVNEKQRFRFKVMKYVLLNTLIWFIGLMAAYAILLLIF